MSVDFTPTNELERLLLAAFTDPTVRPQFYRTLLESELFFIVFYDEIGIGIQPARNGDGEEVIPACLTLDRLKEFARGAGFKEYKHEHSSGRELLTIVEKTNVILNPSTACAKILSPADIRGLLDGSMIKNLKIISIDRHESSLLSEPTAYPQEMIDDLKASFAFSNLVETAYLAQMHQDNRQHPQLVLGLEVEEGYDPDEAMEIVMESLGDDEFITFLKLGDDDISAYMRESLTPFYERSDG
ncbi:MAG: hypothetical protein QOF02_3376 [Blastocatellia bacterium]|jgi:hypothetical protein|nr:hypothetical protein [Blastocatellia bacterium]